MEYNRTIKILKLIVKIEIFDEIHKFKIIHYV